MARTFRQGPRFGSNSASSGLDPLASDMGEDVNPSAYLVNLADCMLVLACGFLVALLTAGSITMSGCEKLESDDMEPIDMEDADPALAEGGDSYLNVGNVYMDPETGAYYLVEGGADASNENVQPDGGGSK